MFRLPRSEYPVKGSSTFQNKAEIWKIIRQQVLRETGSDITDSDVKNSDRCHICFVTEVSINDLITVLHSKTKTDQNTHKQNSNSYFYWETRYKISPWSDWNMPSHQNNKVSNRVIFSQNVKVKVFPTAQSPEESKEPQINQTKKTNWANLINKPLRTVVNV